MREGEIEIKEKVPESGPVSIFIIRHFTPKDYRAKTEEEALVEKKAKAEARQTAAEIIENCPG